MLLTAQSVKLSKYSHIVYLTPKNSDMDYVEIKFNSNLTVIKPYCGCIDW